MADLESTRETDEAYVVSKTPDFCKAPVKPAPFMIVGKFDTVVRTAETVNFTDDPAFTSLSRIVTVVGDAEGVGGGVASGVNLGYCKPISWSRTVKTEGNYIVRHQDEMEMNCAGPDGQGNTVGRIFYVKCEEVTVLKGHVTKEVGREDKEAEEEELDDENLDDEDQEDDEDLDDEDQETDESEEEESEAGEEEGEETDVSEEEGTEGEEPELSDEERAEIEREAAEAQAEAEKAQEELNRAIAQAALDVAGIADPTGVTDVISAGISFSEGDVAGGLLSLVSVIPYVGDAVGKPIKGGRTALKIAKLKEKLAKAGAKLAKIKEKLDKARKVLKKLPKAKPKPKVKPKTKAKAKGKGKGGGKVTRRSKKKSKKESQVVKNKRDGTRRERETEAELKNKHPDADVQREQYLRDKDGKIVKDPVTGEGRRIDHVVIKDGKVVDSVETTGVGVNKLPQLEKEGRIREAGGTYIRDRNTGELIDTGSGNARVEYRP